MSNLTPAERAILFALSIEPSSVVALDCGVAQIASMGHASDPNGAPVILLGFVVAFPADMLRPRREIYGPDGQLIGGGLQEALPVPASVRLVVRLDALSPRYRAEILAATASREPAPPTPTED